MAVVGYLVLASIIVGFIYFVVFMGIVNSNGEPKSRFQDYRQCKGIAKRVWDDIYNNDTLTFDNFEDYWEWLADNNNLN